MLSFFYCVKQQNNCEKFVTKTKQNKKCEKKSIPHIQSEKQRQKKITKIKAYNFSCASGK